MDIKLAHVGDLEQILELQKRCYQEEAVLYNDFHIPPLTQTIDSIYSDYVKGKILKIESRGNIIGSVRGYVEEGVCKIGRLIVDENFRNRGIGKQLMHKIELEFNDAHRFELFTGHKSLRNISLYNKLGYLQFKETRVNDKLRLVFLQKINRRTAIANGE